MSTIPIVVLVGPTASGKTALSIALAKAYDGEIVSADSMQLYKGMNIATAKPSMEERQGIPHHLMDILDANESFSVADYLKLAGDCIRDIHSRGKLPILCGGTGLYVNSLVDNICFEEIVSDATVRSRLSQEAAENGNAHLLERLRQIDPDTAATLHENNLTRVIRAIEVYELTGIPMSIHREQSRQNPSPYHACMLGLNYRDRQLLYDRINVRVDTMLESGLLEEARQVLQGNPGGTAYQAIGYKELRPYFAGEATLDSCIDSIKQESRRYAKRQLTWFRRDERIRWLYVDELGSLDAMAEKAKNEISAVLDR